MGDDSIVGGNSGKRMSRLNETFVELADTLVTGYDVADLLYTLATRCVELFAADQAAVLLKDPDGSLRVVASSHEDAEIMELLELESESGPCWEAQRSGERFGIDDLQAETDRWPEYVQRALDLGYRSVEAIPIRLRQQNVGAIDLFYTQPGGSHAEELSTIQSLADVAAIGLLQARAIEEAGEIRGHLEIALKSRISIEQAKGITSENLGIDMGEGFERLRGYARRNNLKLTRVANDIIDGSLEPSELS